MSPTLIVFAVLAGLAVLHVVVPRLLLGRWKRRLSAVCRQRRAIAITFDDGPGRLLTPLVVQRLAEAKVLATFFLLGHNVKDNEDLVDLIRDAGNEVGSHGERHVSHVWSWPWAGVVDTWEAWQRLHTMLDIDAPRMPFRPPYGKLNLVSLCWVLWMRTPVVLWTHDSFDTRLGKEKSPEALRQEIRQAGGGVVLLHDFDRSITHADKMVLEKLDTVLALRDEGFQFVCVGDLLGLRPAGAGTRAKTARQPTNV